MGEAGKGGDLRAGENKCNSDPINSEMPLRHHIKEAVRYVSGRYIVGVLRERGITW